MILRIRFSIFISIFFCVQSYCQNVQIYQVVLIETKGDFEERAFVMVDSLGYIKSEKDKVGERLELDNFAEAINKLMTSNTVTKVAANNSANRSVRDPHGAQKCLNVYLIKRDDFFSDAEFKNKTYYHYSACQPLDAYNVTGYELFGFLNDANKNTVEKYLR